MAFLLSHGRVKPPLALAQVNWTHPFVRKLLFGAWFNHEGMRHRTGPTFGVGSGQTVIPTWGRIAPRAVMNDGGIWGSNTEGTAFHCNLVTNYIDFGADPMPAAQVTVCLVRKKLDTTNRNPGLAFGSTGATAILTKQCNVNLPFNDGTVYWSFGGFTAGSTRLVLPGLTFSTVVPERWIFTAGPRGMAIWRNGVKLATHATPNPGRVVDIANTFRLNATDAAGGGDLQQFNFFMALDDQWDDALCRWWSAEPYAHLYGTTRRRLVAVA